MIVLYIYFFFFAKHIEIVLPIKLGNFKRHHFGHKISFQLIAVRMLRGYTFYFKGKI